MVEFCPEFPIGCAIAVGGRDEHAVMLALNFGQRITHCAEEIIVRRDDGAVHVEFDNGLGAAHRSDLAGVFHVLDFFAR
jgi:hypothetical protein